MSRVCPPADELSEAGFHRHGSAGRSSDSTSHKFVAAVPSRVLSSEGPTGTDWTLPQTRGIASACTRVLASGPRFQQLQAGIPLSSIYAPAPLDRPGS
ncbi:hypothetical protein T07_13184 [Trichinella nelsoni]|uniref:Uncharacterized protein n=1 Tax=Trichinella nelsoni TaxID=6336 RepID=A0A0V0RWD1_9BILA|nr:hypothetical protein T07_13184 [Trichinella nelsoni]